MRGHLEALVSERISITRGMSALYTLAFYPMRRGFDPPFTLGLQFLRQPQSTRQIFNFRIGKTLRKDLWRQWPCWRTQNACRPVPIAELPSMSSPHLISSGTQLRALVSRTRVNFVGTSDDCHVVAAHACSEAVGPLHSALVLGGGVRLASHRRGRR